jgi:hypothetical protein
MYILPKKLAIDKTNCPADSRRTDVGCEYKSLYDAVEGFAKLGQLPPDVRPFEQFWDEGNCIEATCATHRACWHIKCRQRFFHSTKLERLQKGLADINNNVTVECEVDADVNNCTDSETVDPLSKMPRLAVRRNRPLRMICLFASFVVFLTQTCVKLSLSQLTNAFPCVPR